MASLIRTDDCFYHVTARCNNREWFDIPLSIVWKIMCDNLSIITYAYGVRISIFTLMSNHFHVMFRTTGSNIDQAMQFFMTESSREIAREAGRINHTFGGRYKWCLVTNELYYAHAFKYVARNPVAQGICNQVELYPWGTLHAVYGFSKLLVPLYSANEFEEKMPPLVSLLDWLNTPYKEEIFQNDIQLALRHKHFTLRKTPSRKPHALEKTLS